MVDPQAILAGDKCVSSKLQSRRRDNSKAGAQKLPPTRKPMRKGLALAAVVLGAATYVLHASAGTYPSHVITMVVPYPAGGPTDTIARIHPPEVIAKIITS
jgi:hypothetical protein